MGLSNLSGALSSTPAMQALFSDSASLQRMLDFEAALARAEAQHDVIPALSVDPITAACQVAVIDQSALAQAATSAGNLAIPLVKQLTAYVAQHDAEAAKYVHWGATSQDLIDTALVLQLRDALDLIEAELAQLNHALAELAGTHQDTLMIGRTWLQQALPISFGLKAAGWLDGLLRHQQRLQQLRTRLFVIQFGGAVGSLASLGPKGLQVTATLAAELGLAVPDTPWHTQRDRVAEAATALGLLCGSLGKIACDISLQAQTEIGELSEPIATGRGGSSSMPHKHNPVGCATTLAAALRVPNLVATMLAAMVQEHERALGGWQAEWDSLPQIVGLTASALHQIRQVIDGLGVDAARMRTNLDTTHGLIMAEAVTLALAAKIGRLPAHRLVAEACQQAVTEHLSLRAALSVHPELGPLLTATELDHLLDPANNLGMHAEFIARVLHTYRSQNPYDS